LQREDKTMKRILFAALALTLLNGGAVMAAPGDQGQGQGNQSDTQGHKDHKGNDKGNDKGNQHGAPTAPSDQTAPAHGTPVTSGGQNGPAGGQNGPAHEMLGGQGGPAHPGSGTSGYQGAPAMHGPQPVRDQTAPSVPIFRDQSHNPFFQNKSNVRTSTPRWTRGDRLPDQYRQQQYYVNDWQQHGLRRPPRGYRWVRDDNNDFFLALIATGVISTIVSRNDRDRSWNQHYSRTYSYDDDVYYRECRNQPDPAGILAGAIIGGFLGNRAGHGGSGATIAGVILGGTVGAALTRNMDCEDRSYAYRTYYDGFNSGRTGRYYDWNNPHNGHRGKFRVGSYYNDPYGFRCARFTQTTYIQGRSYNANGVACRQPDGSWAVVN
jgi:Ni/Co efflux regulator RcnB/surface antigen